MDLDADDLRKITGWKVTAAPGGSAWTPDNRALLICCSKSGMYPKEAALLLGRSKGSIWAAMTRMGIRFPRRDPRKGIADGDYLWSTDRVAILTNGRADGLSFSEILRLLFEKTGKAPTRLAAIGKAYRLGLCNKKARPASMSLSRHLPSSDRTSVTLPTLRFLRQPEPAQ